MCVVFSIGFLFVFLTCFYKLYKKWIAVSVYIEICVICAIYLNSVGIFGLVGILGLIPLMLSRKGSQIYI